MVRVDTDVVPLEAEGVLAGWDGPEFVVVLQVRPAPQAAVNDVGKTFAVRDLDEETVQPTGHQFSRSHTALIKGAGINFFSFSVSLDFYRNYIRIMKVQLSLTSLK